ncbi:DUF4249 domain-containing protein [Botryobacter ruber]|uniref:DUF4249 domain-containing protein n=1 Tax=Botryobacter ruber TaxID=2171629 RepID=UPI0013E3A1D2|nr:DUF4249 domain-containing protein [Botryobacter ruber]
MKLLRFNKLVVWLLALFILPACEDDVSNLPNVDMSPRLVVNSYISPQDTELKVQLQMTQPAIGKIKTPEELKVRNATVNLSDGTKTVSLAYDLETDAYKTSAANLPVVAGKTYFLNVSTPGGYKAEASCTVPITSGIAITDLDYNSSVPDWSPQSLDHRLSYKWTDAPNTANYYRTLGYILIRQPDFNGNIQTMKQPFYLSDDETKTYIADQKTSGSLLKSPEFNTNTYDGIGRPGETEYEIHALLIVCDKNYYQYHHSVLTASRTEGNPFAEPTFVYSNIKGGLGVFGAYNEVDSFITVR